MREPTTQTVKLTDARQHFSELVNKVFRRETRIVVEKSGIPVAAIISASDLDEFIRLEREREEDFRALDATREAFKDAPDEELEREIARAIREARAKYRLKADRPSKAS